MRQYHLEYLWELIDEIKQDEGSIRQLARDSGISASTISRILHGNVEDIKLKTFVKLCTALYIEIKLEKGD